MSPVWSVSGVEYSRGRQHGACVKRRKGDGTRTASKRGVSRSIESLAQRADAELLAGNALVDEDGLRERSGAG